jgi:hypothetical protein
VLLQFGLDVLSDQVDGNNVVTLLPGNDHISIPAAAAAVLALAGTE